ncbi:MAG: site-2 protease family protein [Lachnoclostridium sp.]|jgi:regulator of sigma E protease|nr:site-2 protease family protein [Lachnoclostridium sp.]
MNIFIAILIFSVIVIIHELGHFSLAKANKVDVIEFSLGMGPRICTWVKIKEGMKFFLFASTKKLESNEGIAGHTWYSIKLLPIGGSCMMLGEEEAVESENAFNKKGVLARMSVIFAGPFFNFVLAFILALIIVAANGYDKPMISRVMPNQPMAEAGFQGGDIITKINNTNIVINREISTYLQFHKLNGDPVEITAERNGEEITRTVIPVPAKELVKSDESSSEQDLTAKGYPSSKEGMSVYGYQLGFYYSAEREKVDVLGTIKYAAYELKYWIWTTVESLGQLIGGKVSANDISGPVGIVKVVSDTIEGNSQFGFSAVALTVLSISILLTANLGVMNLLPIPALDGGRLVLLIVEGIRRKPNNPKLEGTINFVGFAALMALMVFIVFNDILKIVGG